MVKMKPCPFCGCDDTLHVECEHGVYDPTFEMWYVVCEKCGCNGPSGLDKPSAVEQWNRELCR